MHLVIITAITKLKSLLVCQSRSSCRNAPSKPKPSPTFRRILASGAPRMENKKRSPDEWFGLGSPPDRFAVPVAAKFPLFSATETGVVGGLWAEDEGDSPSQVASFDLPWPAAEPYGSFFVDRFLPGRFHASGRVAIGWRLATPAAVAGRGLARCRVAGRWSSAAVIHTSSCWGGWGSFWARYCINFRPFGGQRFSIGPGGSPSGQASRALC